MTAAEIAHAKARANDCINGFMCVKITQARDVVKLAEALQAANRKLDGLQRKADVTPPEKDFGNIFSDLIRGKKP